MDDLLEAISEWHHTHGEYPIVIIVTRLFYTNNAEEVLTTATEVGSFIEIDDTLKSDWRLV